MSVIIDSIQNILDFNDWKEYPQFVRKEGLGRVALLSYLLGAILTSHTMLLGLLCMHKYDTIQINILQQADPRNIMLLTQWNIYMITLCIFHLAEFFITALFNPTVVTANSFIINHSKAYTCAIMISHTEFWIKFFFFPSLNSTYLFIIGFMITCIAQFIRSFAMKCCGESFNHIIQSDKKENHVLVTHGIYKYLRHPSYVGFFYWSIGTQIMLCNVMSTIMFAFASWSFFSKRIPYEERTLLHHFGENYQSYIRRSYIGIPFVKGCPIVVKRLQRTASSEFKPEFK